jgi:hypothetical protein
MALRSCCSIPLEVATTTAISGPRDGEQEPIIYSSGQILLTSDGIVR